MRGKRVALVLPLFLLLAVQVAPAADAPATGPAAADSPLDHILPRVKFTKVHPRDVFTFLHDISHVKFDVDWDELNRAGALTNVGVTLDVKDKKLSEVLDIILKQLKPQHPLIYRYVDDTVHITSQEHGG